MRRALLALLQSLFLVMVLWPSPAHAQAPPAPPPALSAEAAVLIDGSTGQVLYAKDPLRSLYPASITKIMTAYLAINSPAWTKTLTVSEQAALQPGSSNYLLPGQTLPVAAVTQAMMLTSGNDSAWALAQAVSGSEPAFVRLMNRTARAWGAPGIHFANPTGLPLPDHVVTALGMAIIAQHAMENAVFRKLVDTRQSALPPDPAPRVYYSQNQLLYTYPGANGVKLGYTIEADETLVGSATRHGVFLIVVLLHDTPYGLWGDAAALLTWGFDSFHPVTAVPGGRVLTWARRGSSRIPVAAEGGIVLLAKDGSRRPFGPVHLRFHLAPASGGRRGTVVGVLSVTGRGDRVLAERALVARRGWSDPPPAARVAWTPVWPLVAMLTVLGYVWWIKGRRHAA
ncbi:MAG: D-alanyl-D-alanine carboxypeptidase family protein [Clostridia bacterium]